LISKITICFYAYTYLQRIFPIWRRSPGYPQALPDGLRDLVEKGVGWTDFLLGWLKYIFGNQPFIFQGNTQSNEIVGCVSRTIMGA